MRRQLALLSLAVLVAGCAGPTSGRQQLIVFAAASLTDAFEQVGDAFMQEHPDVDVTFNFGPSNGLATQIIQGAPADAFASASQKPMDDVAGAELVQGQPRIFVRNLLEIAVEPGNPLGIKTLRDLARSDVTLVLAAPGVPAGDFSRQALDQAGVKVTPASLEVDVRAVLTKVELGEADAGIVYVTDVISADGEVEGVPIPEGQNVQAAYPIATLTGAPNPKAARAFTDLVLSPRGQQILGKYGFAEP
ncbi:MAG: molybdate ABC transporter substrate-binding protein [Egibacteraceae bacterium]